MVLSLSHITLSGMLWVIYGCRTYNEQRRLLHIVIDKNKWPNFLLPSSASGLVFFDDKYCLSSLQVAGSIPIRAILWATLLLWCLLQSSHRNLQDIPICLKEINPGLTIPASLSLMLLQVCAARPVWHFVNWPAKSVGSIPAQASFLGA